LAHDQWEPPAAEEGETPAQAMARALVSKGSTHVYLHYINEEFAGVYAELFEDSAIVAQGGLYRVSANGERVVLSGEP